MIRNNSGNLCIQNAMGLSTVIVLGKGTVTLTSIIILCYMLLDNNYDKQTTVVHVSEFIT